MQIRRYTDRLHAVAGRVTGPCPVPAGRRERRHPAEALPLGQLRVWTTLFGPFTVAAWERQAPTRDAPSGTTPPAERGGPRPFTRVAGARPHVGSARRQTHWSFGRPPHRLGTMVPGSFTSDLAIHVNRIGGRSAGADLTA